MRWKIKLNLNKLLYCNWLKGNWKAIMRELPDVGTAQPSPGEVAETWGGRGAPWGKDERGGGDELWSYGTMLQHFLWRNTYTHTHTLSSGPLGPKEMSVCGLIQPPVPVLMMASTCCFNVTAGSPYIPHWLWLPSAAGSSPLLPSSHHLLCHLSFLHPLHFNLLFLLPLISILPPPIHPSLCYTPAHASFSTPFCSTKSFSTYIALQNPSHLLSPIFVHL